MQEHGGKMALFSDEGGIFDILSGRYSNGIPNLDLWLKGHSVSPVRVDRQDASKMPIRMDRPHLTVGISPQPQVLASLWGRPGFRSRGFLARWLYALPSSKLGSRTLEPRPIPTEIEGQYQKGISNLLDYEPGATVTLRLSTSAYSEWKQFQRSLEPQLLDGGILCELKDWGAKLAGASLRLAGILHMVLQSEKEARRRRGLSDHNEERHRGRRCTDYTRAGGI